MSGKAVPGWLYVLSSPSMPGILKIGHTTRAPEVRAVELADATGVPCAFVSEHVQQVPNSEALEAVVHRILAHRRPSPNREFFICGVDEAKDAIAAAVAGTRPKGEPPAFAGSLPAGWRPPAIPAKRLPSDRLGQIQGTRQGRSLDALRADMQDWIEEWDGDMPELEMPPLPQAPPPPPTILDMLRNLVAR